MLSDSPTASELAQVASKAAQVVTGQSDPQPQSAAAAQATPTAQVAGDPAPASSPIVGAAADAGAKATPHTITHLSGAIVRRLGERSSRFDVALQPEGLGKVNVRIEIGADGRISAAMAFDNPQAASELRSRSEELRQALQAAGFDLSGRGLSFDVASQGGGGRDAWGQGPSRDPGFAGRAFQSVVEAADEPLTLLPTYDQSARLGRTGVDIRI